MGPGDGLLGGQGRTQDDRVLRMRVDRDRPAEFVADQVGDQRYPRRPTDEQHRVDLTRLDLR